jgi:2-keto-4-pentenoate hydratase/2-oxohepta-3-ene-1,7-dioic acid hydratase in catechol pathway
MRLATFQPLDQDASEIGAVIEGDRIVRFNRARPGMAQDMVDLITRWADLEGEVRRLAAAAAETLPLDRVRLLAPVPRPEKIMAIGLNYADHIAETGQETPKSQIWFSKQLNAVAGPFDSVQIPKASAFVDYEGEMVAVVGVRGRHISRDAAPAAIFGWCVGNDVSERAWQNRSSQWVLGKSFDTHAPFGPWITTADEITDPHALNLRTLVNGEIRQNSNTRHLVFDVWAQIAELSQAMTLEPGDIIYTGTPGGVGVAMRPPVALRAGDRVRVEVDGLGYIENGFEPEA